MQGPFWMKIMEKYFLITFSCLFRLFVQVQTSALRLNIQEMTQIFMIFIQIERIEMNLLGIEICPACSK